MESLSDTINFAKMTDTKCTKKGGYTHWLLHSDKIPPKQFRQINLSFYHLALAFGFYTPYIRAHEKWKMLSVPQFQAATRNLRWAVWQDRRILHGIYDKAMFVAPEKWPKDVRESFRLEDPPTPYEVACVILVEPHANFWSLHVGAPKYVQCSLATLKWWLMGMNEEVLSSVLGVDKAALHEILATAVNHAMHKTKFAVWALGGNLIPVCTNRIMLQVAESFALGKPLPSNFKGGGATQQARTAQDRLFNHPYVQAQLKSGARIGPLCRPVFLSDIVWNSISEKRHWESLENRGAKQTLKIRKQISKYPEQHPEWLDL